jgi:DNA repair protein RadA/Sms
MARTATRERPAFRCGECGWTVGKWVGRCGECQAWGTVEDASAPPVRTTAAGPVSAAARPIAEVDVEAARALPTGVDELDRVLGGGLVPGAVVLLAGEPGVGKSTLLLDVAARCAGRGRGRTLYVTGEESAAQVRLRADRIGALHDDLLLAAETDLAAVLGHVEQVAPALLVVDSVQTVASAEVDGSPGNVSQVREVAGALIRVAKERGIATVLVGHVTRTGPSPVRGCSSTSSTWSCTSRATGTRGCAWCAGSRTATAPPTRSAASTSPTTASSACPTRAGCSSRGGARRSPAPA